MNDSRFALIHYLKQNKSDYVKTERHIYMNAAFELLASITSMWYYLLFDIQW